MDQGVVMKLVSNEIIVNEDAVAELEDLLIKVKEGSITSIACCYVTNDRDTGGVFSSGEDALLMWAGMIHMERSFYDEFIG